MKQNIHPQYYQNCTVTCSCGNSFVTGSTLPSIKIDICDKCHPFFTGEMKFVDRQGRVDKFLKKIQLAQAKQDANKKKQANKKKTTADKQTTSDEAKSYKEILREQQNRIKQVKAVKKT